MSTDEELEAALDEERSTEEAAPPTEELVESTLVLMIKERVIEPEFQDTMKLVLYALHVGTNPDTIARVSGLNRGFVRTRAKALRENEIFVGGPMKRGKILLTAKTDDEFMLELVLFVMCAEGLACRTTAAESDPSALTYFPSS